MNTMKLRLGRVPLVVFVSFSLVSCALGSDDMNEGQLPMVTETPVNGFSWHANRATTPMDPRQQAVLLNAAAAQPHGNSPWICSPVGFGQKSTCTAR
jgi:hypothetical protein